MKHRRVLEQWIMLMAAWVAGCAPIAGPPPEPAARPGFTAGPVSATDQEIMARLAAGRLYEIEVSRLAVARATDPRVRSYAQMLVDHGSNANGELTDLMRAKGVAMAPGLAPDKQTKLQRLARLRPSPNFDEGYVRVVGVEDHMAAVRVFEWAHRVTQDRDLRAWIERNLPVVRSDLAEARKLTGALFG